MNARDPNFPLADTQSSTDNRSVVIDAVGVGGLRYPLRIRSGAQEQATIAEVSMTVGLAAETRGTHMSRFIELLESVHDQALDLTGLVALADTMLSRLRAARGSISLKFPYFVRKTAPVSGVQSLLDCVVQWQVTADGLPGSVLQMTVTTPVTSLCPCSRAISRYGAHNQRSNVCIRAQLREHLQIEDLVRVAEAGASCALYGLLKRPDEKYVTEHAYDNPKFVEDMVRDVTVALSGDTRIDGFEVEVENVESIHNHSAIARVTRPALRIR